MFSTATSFESGIFFLLTQWGDQRLTLLKQQTDEWKLILVEYTNNIDTRLTAVSSTIPNFRGDIDSFHLLDMEKEDKEVNVKCTRVINDTNYDTE